MSFKKRTTKNKVKFKKVLSQRSCWHKQISAISEGRSRQRTQSPWNVFCLDPRVDAPS